MMTGLYQIIRPLLVLVFTTSLISLTVMPAVAQEYENEQCQNFTSVPTPVICTMYTQSGDCDTVADSIPRVNDSGPGQRVSDLKIEVLILDRLIYPTYNKVRITWRSPNYLALQQTQGFRMVINKVSEGRKLCRFIMVNTTDLSITQSDAEKTIFGYESGYLSANTYNLELTAYPLPLYDLPVPTKLFFSTYHTGTTGVYTPNPPATTVPTTTTESPTLNTTISVEIIKPYSVTVRFARAFYGDTRYNHTSYRLTLTKYGAFDPATHVNGSDVELIQISKVVQGEGVVWTQTFNDIMPGSYQARITPFQKVGSRAGCLEGGCIWADDDNTYNSQIIELQGEDYLPMEKTTLLIDGSEVSQIEVKFSLAPAKLYIERYSIIVKNQDREKEIGSYTPEVAEVTDEYSVKTLEFTQNLLGTFKEGDQLHLEVKPILQFKTTMCPGSGNKYQYNYNGTCVPFTVSKSEPVEFKLQASTNPPGAVGVSTTDAGPLTTGALVMAIVLPILGVIVILILVFLLIGCMKRRGWTVKDLCKRGNKPAVVLSHQELDHEQPGGDDVRELDYVTIGGGTALFINIDPQIPVCIAFKQSPAYTKMAHKMKDIMENYFNCEVQFYNGESNRTSTRDRECVIVLNSEHLMNVYNAHYRTDSVSMIQQHQTKTSLEQKDMPISRILDLLQTPQSTDNHMVMLATFEHLDRLQCDKLSICSGKRQAAVFSLPKEFQNMMQKVLSPRSGGCREDTICCPAWKEFIKSSEKTDLEQSISGLAVAEQNLDSGLGGETQSMATYVTVATTTPPIQPDFDGRLTTITDPTSQEMYYLRENSLEPPLTPGSDPGNPLLNAQLPPSRSHPPTAQSYENKPGQGQAHMHWTAESPADTESREKVARDQECNTYLSVAPSVAPSETGEDSLACSIFIPPSSENTQYLPAAQNGQQLQSAENNTYPHTNQQPFGSRQQYQQLTGPSVSVESNADSVYNSNGSDYLSSGKVTHSVEC